MKKLLLRVLVYAFITSGLYAANIFIMGFVFSQEKYYKIPPNKNVLVAGDSHLSMGVNDSMLDNVFNLAQPAEAYMYTYVKLKKVLPLNPHINTVIIGCANHNVTQYIADLTLRFTQERVQNYFHLLGPGNLTYLLIKRPGPAIKGIVGMPKIKYPYFIRGLKSERLTFDELKFGGFFRGDSVINSARDKEFWMKVKRDKVDVTTVSQWQVENLHKIVELCHARNVKLILMRTPEHKLFPKPIEPVFIRLLQEQFSDVTFKDYIKLDLPDSCFFDMDHLNYAGAAMFTPVFKRYVESLE